MNREEIKRHVKRAYETHIHGFRVSGRFVGPISKVVDFLQEIHIITDDEDARIAFYESIQILKDQAEKEKSY